MIPDLLFDRYEDEDLVTQFEEYTVDDLRSNLLQLIQTNVVYSYCETLIAEDIDCTEEDIAKIIESCKGKNQALLNNTLPFRVLHQLKKVKDELKESNCSKHDTINLILNLIVENTLLHSTLAKFAYN